MSNANGLKRIRTAALVLCGAMLAVLPAMAQQDSAPPPPPSPDQMQGPPPGGMRGRGGMNPERRLEMMQKELNLTPDQMTQVRAIFADGRAKNEAMRSDTTLSDGDRRMKMMEMMKTESVKIRAVLNPDQQTKYDAMIARQRERMREQRQDGGAMPPPPNPPQ